MSGHGTPWWYELGTSDIDAAAAFYGSVLGWTVGGSEMPDHDYRLARIGDSMIAGLMSNETQQGNPPPNWVVYFAVDDCDATTRAAADAGGRILMPATDVPGTGRFAVLADPQGAVFGIMQPEPMDVPGAGAFDQGKPGHGNWHELMTTAPEAAMAFYAALFGWAEAETLDMGTSGTYHIFATDGQSIGGMMALGEAPVPCWMPYFGTEDIDAAVARIAAGGGMVRHGPHEVPGGAFIAIATDPQQAWFAVVGQRPGTS